MSSPKRPGPPESPNRTLVSDPSEESAAQQALARFAASSGERNRTLEAVAENYPAKGERVRAEVPFSSEWKWSGLSFGRGETPELFRPVEVAG